MLWDGREKRDIDLGRIKDFWEEKGFELYLKEVVIEWMLCACARAGDTSLMEGGHGPCVQWARSWGKKTDN